MQKATDKEDLKFFQNSKKPKNSKKEGETGEKRGIEDEVAAYIKEVCTFFLNCNAKKYQNLILIQFKLNIRMYVYFKKIYLVIKYV